MAKNIKDERMRWVLPIVNKEIRLSDAARICPYGKRTLERWVAAYREGGEEALAPASTEPKRYRVETPIRVKERVVVLRKKTGLCALKLRWRLEKEGIYLHERTIGKILKKEGLTRRYRTKKVRYKYIRAERRPGELLEIDVKHVPGALQGRKYYQYTAIDTASRWRYLRIFEEESSFHSVRFLEDVIRRFPYPVLAVKTDNHSTFTNRHVGGLAKRSDLSPVSQHGLDRFCAGHGIIHYLIDPGKPAQNGTVERSHREDQEKFYDRNIFNSLEDLQRKIRAWNMRYNDLEHCGLGGKTPNEFLVEYSKSNPPDVCA